MVCAIQLTKHHTQQHKNSDGDLPSPWIGWQASQTAAQVR